jgi:hypothetical protein
MPAHLIKQYIRGQPMSIPKSKPPHNVQAPAQRLIEALCPDVQTPNLLSGVRILLSLQLAKGLDPSQGDPQELEAGQGFKGGFGIERQVRNPAKHRLKGQKGGSGEMAGGQGGALFLGLHKREVQRSGSSQREEAPQSPYCNRAVEKCVNVWGSAGSTRHAVWIEQTGRTA